jgi:hypothetical protein
MGGSDEPPIMSKVLTGMVFILGRFAAPAGGEAQPGETDTEQSESGRLGDGDAKILVLADLEGAAGGDRSVPLKGP